ncbi:hypothetical protein PGT21_004715 [Puccinia graminis f. sp. tritici]|uniref:Uncharacterized protein n=1 Tax=Puccinia graminis f. sp. tritici TaxID=56615 RepID=A0A5B0M4A4_PUCGR|nr:hypothetical protein PGT21_004715 [Puccinia graminis f. sp. tritici]KAA1123178.1 hypothetical protein PGTUg99_019813 [Puccinia graminis f. sp. tritici]
MCCQKGKVKLPCADVTAPQIPLFLENLLPASDAESKTFQKFIRAYNTSVF